MVLPKLQEKVWERVKISDVMEEGEKLNFNNEITEILTTQNCYPSECEVPEVLVLRETNCGNQVAEILGKGGKWKYELWQPSCRNLGEEFKKKKKICGNWFVTILITVPK